MRSNLLRIFAVFVSINWFDVGKSFAQMATPVIGFLALRNWQRQDKAKRKAEFLDALIEATHTYITEIRSPIFLLNLTKTGMDSHSPTWESEPSEDSADLSIKGAIFYIKTYGKQEAKRIFEALNSLRIITISLRSLAAKGQVFDFSEYTKCQNAITMLTWHFDRIEAFAAVLDSQGSNWDHPTVRGQLNIVMDIDIDAMSEDIQSRNIAILEFVRGTHKRIYG